MKYISISLEELNAAKFVRPTRMYHGTSIKRLNSILKHGLGSVTVSQQSTTKFNPLFRNYLTPNLLQAITYGRQEAIKDKTYEGCLVICDIILQNHNLGISDDYLLGMMEQSFFSRRDPLISIKNFFETYLPKRILPSFQKVWNNNQKYIRRTINSYITDYSKSFNKKSCVDKHREALKNISKLFAHYTKYLDSTQVDNNLKDQQVINIATDTQIGFKGSSKIVGIAKFNITNSGFVFKLRYDKSNIKLELEKALLAAKIPFIFED